MEGPCDFAFLLALSLCLALLILPFFVLLYEAHFEESFSDAGKPSRPSEGCNERAVKGNPTKGVMKNILEMFRKSQRWAGVKNTKRNMTTHMHGL